LVPHVFSKAFLVIGRTWVVALCYSLNQRLVVFDYKFHVTWVHNLYIWSQITCQEKGSHVGKAVY